jgi:hypothetical protein
MTLNRTGIALTDGQGIRLADASVDHVPSRGRSVMLALAVLVILVMVVM